MESFLKETIFGIILLGAIGSILAAVTIWIINRVIKILAPKLYSFIRGLVVRILVFAIKPGIKRQVHLVMEENLSNIDAYYASQQSKITITLAIATWLFVWMLFRIKVDQLEAFTIEAISYISIMFLLVGFAIRSYLSLLVPFFFDVGETVQEAIKDLPPEVQEAYRKYKANKLSKGAATSGVPT